MRGRETPGVACLQADPGEDVIWGTESAGLLILHFLFLGLFSGKIAFIFACRKPWILNPRMKAEENETLEMKPRVLTLGGSLKLS